MENLGTTIENYGNEAVRRLRLQKLSNGLPFMINSPDLPSTQCFLEYPDGKIVLVTLIDHARDFSVIRILSATEVNSLRVKYNFPVFHA